MDRVSDEWIDEIINTLTERGRSTPHQSTDNYTTLSMAVELRDRRQAEEAPCPEHAKMVAEWDIQGGEI